MNSASGPVSCKTGQCWLRDNLGKEGIADFWFSWRGGCPAEGRDGEN